MLPKSQQEPPQPIAGRPLQMKKEEKPIYRVEPMKPPLNPPQQPPQANPISLMDQITYKNN